MNKRMAFLTGLLLLAGTPAYAQLPILCGSNSGISCPTGVIQQGQVTRGSREAPASFENMQIAPEVGFCSNGARPRTIGDTTICPTLLQQAYEACERHIISPCKMVIDSDLRSDAIPGQKFTVTSTINLCTGPYEWAECNKVASQWIGSPERIKAEEEELRAHLAQNKADREIVAKAGFVPE